MLDVFFAFWVNLTKEGAPLDPSHKIRSEIPHRMTCLTAPHLLCDLERWPGYAKHGNPILTDIPMFNIF